MSAVPAWKLQLQQNIAKKKSEKLKQEEQRRIQLLPPWKRAAIEQQTQPKNVIIITNSSSTSKTTSTVSNSTTKTVVTNAKSTGSANGVKTVNSINNEKPKNVSIVSTAKQKSPTHVANSNHSSGTYGNRVALKQTGKSQSIDHVDKQVNNNIVSSKSFDENDGNDDLGVSDEHCISVHNNPFLRREKKGGVNKPNLGGQVGLGGRQKVQDSTSPTAGSSTSPRVAWNNKSPTHGANSDNNKSSVVTSKENVTKNNFVIEKQKPATSPTRKVVFKQPEIINHDTERQSRSTERKLSVHEIMKQFGRAASHEEKDRIRKQSSTDESDIPSPRSQSSKRDYRNRERSPSPVKNRYRSAQNLKPRPKSTPVEVPSSVILSHGIKKSPTSSPQPVRRSFHGTTQDKTQAPKPPTNVGSSPKKVVINTKSPSPKHQPSKAPQVSVSETSKPANINAMNGTGAVIIAKKKHLDYDTNDAGRTPPMRRKTPLPASAIIDLNTKGPIQEASGKPPVDPEIIAKEKATSIPKSDNKSSIQSKSSSSNDDAEKPKPNTVSSLLGSFGFGKKSKAPSAPVSAKPANQNTPADAIPYPEDFRRPKSWQEKQQENKNTLPAQVDLKPTKPANSENESTNSTKSRPTVEDSQPVEISPIPRSSSYTVSPIPKSETITNGETISPIPNREITSSETNNVTVNGHVEKTVNPEDSPSKGKGEASNEMMAKARALKKVKKKVNYEVIGGNAPTGKPSMQASKSGRNRGKSKLEVSFNNDHEEFEYQSEQSLLAELGEGEEEEEEEPEDDRHSSVSEDEEVAPAPSGFRENVPKGTGGLQSYTPSYLRDLTPSAMREYQEATRRKEEPKKEPEPEPLPYETEDAFSSAGSNSAAMLF